MTTNFKTAQIILGDSIFERLADITVPRELKTPVATFKKVHVELSARQKVVQTLFAAPSAMEQPKTRRAKKKAATTSPNGAVAS